MSFLDIVKALLPLLLIVGLLYGALVFVKRYGISVRGKKSGAVSIDVISTQMIMPKKFISIVRVEDKLLVLGISDQSITFLKEMDKPYEAVSKPSFETDKNNFLDLLKKNLGMK